MAQRVFYCPHCKHNTFREEALELTVTHFGQQTPQTIVCYTVQWGCTHAEKLYNKMQRKRASAQIRSASIMGIPPLVP